MAKSPLMVQEVEYLSVTNATITCDDSSEKQKIVVITIRPDEGSFRPHNISVTREQAHRLWEDLGFALKRSSVLLGFLLLGAVGCSTKVEVVEETARLPLTENADQEPQQVITTERRETAVTRTPFVS